MKFKIHKKHLYILAPVGLYIAIAFIFFGKSFFEQTFWGGDFIGYYLPNVYYFLNNLKAGILPMWQPYSFMGLPFLFQPALTHTYPPIWILYIVNIVANNSLNFNILGKTIMLYNISHLILGAYGTFLLLKNKFKLSWWPSFLSGLIYSFGFFNLYELSNSSVLLQRMWYPVLVYCALELFENPNKLSFLKLALVNFIIFTLGYPYNFIYFFIAQLLLALSFNAKKIMPFLSSVLLSFLLSAIFLFPQLNLYLNSSRYSLAATDPSFHKLYSEIPTHIVGFFIPLYGNTIFSDMDPGNVFTFGKLTFGVVGLVLFLYGLTNLKKRTKYSWLVLCLILPPIYSFGYYFYSIDILSSFIPLIDKLRSHYQALLITYFAGTIIIGHGFEALLKGARNKVIDSTLLIAFISGMLVLVASPIINAAPLIENSLTNWYIGLSRFLVLLIFTLLVINLRHIIGKKLFIFLIFFLCIIELNLYSNLIEFNRIPGSYTKVMSKNKLITNTGNTEDLFRYDFDGNQFGYNSSTHSVFSRLGYETTPYEAAYKALNLPFIESLSFSNVKYYVSVRKDLAEQYPENLELIQTLVPGTDDYHLYLSSLKTLPWWTTESENSHYIYELKEYMPRFYISSVVKNCNSDECIVPLTPDEETLVEDIDFTIGVQDASETKISVLSYTPNKIVLESSSSIKSFISSSEVWDKGWKVYIDETRSTLYKTNGGFRGFIVPEGKSIVTLTYFPAYFKLGAITSVFGLLLLIYFYKFMKYPFK